MGLVACTLCKVEHYEDNMLFVDGKAYCNSLCYNAYYVANNIKISSIPSGPEVVGLTDAELRAAPIPVSGPITDEELRNTPVPVLGPLTDIQLRASAIPVIASPRNASRVMKTGNLVTTSNSADQVILTYTVTAGKTFYLQYLKIDTRLTSFATTATNFGFASIENPAGSKLLTQIQSGAGITLIPPYYFNDIPIPAGTVIRVVCTPAAATSYTWQANFGGYEL
jgi:hypothetical protein